MKFARILFPLPLPEPADPPPEVKGCPHIGYVVPLVHKWVRNCPLLLYTQS